MADITKAQRRILREIAGEVYEAEARRLLEELDAKFHRWREGAVASSELIGEIHEFHQHGSRDLWSIYRVLRADSIVARGVALGLIPPERVPLEVLTELQLVIEHFRHVDEQPIESDEE
jgi:hypothetical protein